MDNKILVLLGKSGVGKDTLASMIKERLEYNFIVSHTTRPKREGESNGNPYYFIGKHLMFEFQDKNELIECRSYDTILNGEEDTWYYAVHKSEVEEDKKYVVVLDIEGLKDFKKIFGNRIVSIYIFTDDKIRESRAKKRGGFCQEEWDRRLQTDSIDFSREKVVENIDYFIENNKIEYSYKSICKLI